jgi:hypothetical protein
VGRFTLYQFPEGNRQRPSARGELAEQIAVHIIHLRANEDSDPSPVAPDAAVSNHRNDLRRNRIENTSWAKMKSLVMVFAARRRGCRRSRWLRDDRAATVKTRS